MSKTKRDWMGELQADIDAMNRREALYPDLLAFVRRMIDEVLLPGDTRHEARELVRRAEASK